MGHARARARVRVAATALFLLWLSMADLVASSVQHCEYANKYMRWNNISIGPGSESSLFCRREVESLRYPTCCNRELETHMFRLVVDGFNQALLNVTQRKIGYIYDYWRYLVDQHVLDAIKEVRRYSVVLNATGQYDTQSPLWKAVMKSEEDVVAQLRLVAQQRTTFDDLSITMVIQVENIVKMLINQHVLKAAGNKLSSNADRQNLAQLRQILVRWESSGDIIASLFEERENQDRTAFFFARAVERYNQTILMLNIIDQFWQEALGGIFPAHADLYDPKAGLVQSCMMEIMQVTKCSFCYVSTKDYGVCPDMFINETTCLGNFLSQLDYLYSETFSYIAGVHQDYLLKYLEDILHHAERYVASVQSLVARRWMDMLIEAVEQHESSNPSGSKMYKFVKKLGRLNSLNLEFTTPNVSTSSRETLLEESTAYGIIAKFVQAPDQYFFLKPLREQLMKAYLIKPNATCPQRNPFVGDSRSFSLDSFRSSPVAVDARWVRLIDRITGTLKCFECHSARSDCDCENLNVTRSRQLTFNTSVCNIVDNKLDEMSPSLDTLPPTTTVTTSLATDNPNGNEPIRQMNEPIDQEGDEMIDGSGDGLIEPEDAMAGYDNQMDLLPDESFDSTTTTTSTASTTVLTTLKHHPTTRTAKVDQRVKTDLDDVKVPAAVRSGASRLLTHSFGFICSIFSLLALPYRCCV